MPAVPATITGGISKIAQTLSGRLNTEIDRGNDFVAFMTALCLAVLKDIIDLTLDASLIGLIPIIGDIPGIFLSVFLTAFLYGKGWFITKRIKTIWWVASVIFDNLPAFNALPIETLTVLYTWHIVRKRSNAAREKLKNIDKITEQEMQNLNADVSLLDVEPA